MRPWALAFLLAGTCALPAIARDFYAAPFGSAKGNGSIAAPWDLGTALSQPHPLGPGDTLWLRGGTYRGLYRTTLTGAPGRPIVVRSFGGEWARLDGVPAVNSVPVLEVHGAHACYRDFEVTTSDPRRVSREATPYPNDVARGDCIRIDQSAPRPGLKLVNLVLHDGRSGIACQRLDTGIEIYGNLIYYSGWDGPTKGYGHGIYPQNQSGTMRIVDNVIFSGYDRALHAYSEKSALDHLDIEGNTLFNGGILSRHGAGQNILVGGTVAVRFLRLVGNLTWFGGLGSPSSVGYDQGPEVSDALIEGNTFASGVDPQWGVNAPLRIVNPGQGVQIEANTFYGTPTGFSPEKYPRNRYLGSVRPTRAMVFVRPNAWEPGRATITVYNWPGSPTVDVDVGGLLAAGAPFEVRNAADYFGRPVLRGTFTGAPLRLPMSGLGVAEPCGREAPPSTGPEFNVFVVIPLGSKSTTSPQARSRQSAGPSGAPALRPHPH